MADINRLATILMRTHDPYLVKELLREVGILRRMGMDVVIFLIDDGGDIAFPEGIRRNSRDPQLAQELIDGIGEEIDQGTTILICKKCLQERSTGDENDLGKMFVGISPDAFNSLIDEALQAGVNLSIQGITKLRLEEIIDARVSAALAARQA